MKARKVSLTLICAVLSTSIMAACASPATTSTTKSASASAQDTADQTAGGTVSGTASSDGIIFDEQGHFVKYDPVITLTTNAIVGTDTMFHDGDSAEDNGWTRWMRDKLGIEWKMKWVSADASSNSQKLDLAFASDDLPDVISGASVDQIAKFAKAGKLLALDSYLDNATDKYPLVDYYVKDAETQSQGSFWLPFMINGEKYSMPAGMDSLAYWSDNFIRTDILSELGLSIPTTISELEDVFAKYKEAYPSGTALALNKDLGGIEAVTTAYEAYPSMWLEKDGQLVYGSIQPEMKEALGKLAEWYQKGYIDSEFVVQDGNKVNENVIAGNVLLYNGNWASIASPFTPLWNADPDATVEAIPFIQGDDGRVGVMKNTWWTDSRAISASCQYPEAMFYLLNDDLDSYYRNEQDLRDSMKTDYGYDFKYPVTEVQEPTNADEIAENYPNIGQPRQLYLYDYSEAEEGCGFINDYYTQQSSWLGFYCKIVSIGNNDFKTMVEAEKTGDESVLSYDGERMYDEWNNTHPNMLKTFVNIYDYWDGLMTEDDSALHSNAFSGASTAAMTEKKTYLDKLQLETFTKIIMGSESLDAFDQFVSDWNSNGGEDITKEVNEWYQENQGS